MVGLILRYKKSAMPKNDTIHVSIMSFLCIFAFLSLNLSTYQGALDDHLLRQDVSREPGNGLSPPSPGNQGWCANDRVLELPILGRMGDILHFTYYILLS